MAAVASVTIITMQIIPQTSASALDRVKPIITVRISDGENEGIASLYGNGENYINNNRLSQEQYLLRNVVQSFANKLYVQKVFLDN